LGGLFGFGGRKAELKEALTELPGKFGLIGGLGFTGYQKTLEAGPFSIGLLALHFFLSSNL